MKPSASPAAPKLRSAKTAKPVATDATRAYLKQIETALEDGKAEDLVVIDLKDKSSIADYLVIGSGNSSRQLAALADRVLEALKAKKRKRISVEGLETGEWVLIDAGDVIVHLFRPEIRLRYQLEKMWGADFSEAAFSQDAADEASSLA